MLLKGYIGVMVIFGILRFIIFMYESCCVYDYVSSNVKERDIQKVNLVKKVLDFWLIIVVLYLIFMLTCSIYYHYFVFWGIPILTFISIFCDFYVTTKKKGKWFALLGMTRFLLTLLGIFYVTIVLALSTNSVAIDGKYEIEENVQKVDLAEYKLISNTSENEKFYVKIDSDNVYWFEYMLQNGSTTTKSINANENYVEKCESDEYIENPHIDVKKVYKTYTNYWGDKCKSCKSIQYYIYVPTNAIYYQR